MASVDPLLTAGYTYFKDPLSNRKAFKILCKHEEALLQQNKLNPSFGLETPPCNTPSSFTPKKKTPKKKT